MSVLEELPQFGARINRAVQLDEEDLILTTAEDEGWTLSRIRDVRSVHSDIWIGSAAELPSRKALAVFPIAGWWKEKAQFQRYGRDVRYSLCITLRGPTLRMSTRRSRQLCMCLPLERLRSNLRSDLPLRPARRTERLDVLR